MSRIWVLNQDQFESLLGGLCWACQDQAIITFEQSKFQTNGYVVEIFRQPIHTAYSQHFTNAGEAADRLEEALSNMGYTANTVGFRPNPSMLKSGVAKQPLLTKQFMADPKKLHRRDRFQRELTWACEHQTRIKFIKTTTVPVIYTCTAECVGLDGITPLFYAPVGSNDIEAAPDMLSLALSTLEQTYMSQPNSGGAYYTPTLTNLGTTAPAGVTLSAPDTTDTLTQVQLEVLEVMVRNWDTIGGGRDLVTRSMYLLNAGGRVGFSDIIALQDAGFIEWVLEGVGAPYYAVTQKGIDHINNQ